MLLDIFNDRSSKGIIVRSNHLSPLFICRDINISLILIPPPSDFIIITITSDTSSDPMCLSVQH